MAWYAAHVHVTVTTSCGHNCEPYISFGPCYFLMTHDKGNIKHIFFISLLTALPPSLFVEDKQAGSDFSICIPYADSRLKGNSASFTHHSVFTGPVEYCCILLPPPFFSHI